MHIIRRIALENGPGYMESDKRRWKELDEGQRCRECGLSCGTRGEKKNRRHSNSVILLIDISYLVSCILILRSNDWCPAVISRQLGNNPVVNGTVTCARKMCA